MLPSVLGRSCQSAMFSREETSKVISDTVLLVVCVTLSQSPRRVQVHGARQGPVRCDALTRGARTCAAQAVTDRAPSTLWRRKFGPFPVTQSAGRKREQVTGPGTLRGQSTAAVCDLGL